MKNLSFVPSEGSERELKWESLCHYGIQFYLGTYETHKIICSPSQLREFSSQSRQFSVKFIRSSKKISKVGLEKQLIR